MKRCIRVLLFCVLLARASAVTQQNNLPNSTPHLRKTFNSVNGNLDSIENYERHVTDVIKNIHKEEQDLTLPWVHRYRSLTFTKIWDLKDWEVHRSRWRYVKSVINFPTSRLLRQIFPQLMVLITWSIIVSVLGKRSPHFNAVHVPFSTLSLISGFVAALQTLRSNQGLSRLADGRAAMGNAILLTRDSAHLFSRYLYPKDKQLGLLAARHLSLYCWLLKAHLREAPEDDVLRTMLPNSRDHDFVASQRKKPVALLSRLRQIVSNAQDRQLLSSAQELRLEQNIYGLEEVIMLSERLRGSPIPPVYSTIAQRLLLVYLIFLPLALVGSQLSGYVTLLVTGATGYAMLGLDEVSHMLEQPFRLMPLYQLSKVSMMDVSDAFTCEPPSLTHDKSVEDWTTRKPTYW